MPAATGSKHGNLFFLISFCFLFFNLVSSFRIGLDLACGLGQE